MSTSTEGNLEPTAMVIARAWGAAARRSGALEATRASIDGAEVDLSAFPPVLGCLSASLLAYVQREMNNAPGLGNQEAAPWTNFWVR